MKDRKILKEYSLILVVVLACVVIGLFAPEFLTIRNFLNIGKQSAIIVIASIGVALAIITKGIDLSIGGTMPFCALICGTMMLNGVHPVFSIVVGLLIGCGVGLLNGLIIAKMNVPPFIVTFVMANILSGFTLVICKGFSIGAFPAGYVALGNSKLLGIPVPIFIMVFFVIVGAVLLFKTPIGNHILAMGNSENALKTIGVNVDRVKCFIYVLSGFCGAAAGILLSATMDAVHPTQGASYQLDTVAACVIGGTSMLGGEGNMVMVMVGAISMSIIRNALNMFGLHPFFQNMIIGAVIIAVVAITINTKERALRRQRTL